MGFYFSGFQGPDLCLDVQVGGMVSKGCGDKMLERQIEQRNLKEGRGKQRRKKAREGAGLVAQR